MIKQFKDKIIKKGGLDEASLWNELSYMPDFLLVLTDSNFALTWANEYFYEYFNCRPSDTLGRPMYGFLGEDARSDMDEDHIRRVLEEMEVNGHESRTTLADGEFVTIRWNQRAFESEGKKWILSLGFPPLPEESIPDTMSMDSVATKKIDYNDLKLNTGMYVGDDPEMGLDLDRLIKKENFILHYQPRVNARTKAIVGAEGLVRMMHPERGLLYPASFLSAVEKSGHILRIGAYVFDAACRKLQEWQNDDKGMVLSLSINISPKQLYDANFVQFLLEVTTKHRIEPHRIMIELSERTIASHFKEADQIIQMLKDAGFMVAIDDFSTRFLPLAALTTLDLDNITIDRSYIAESESDPRVNLVIESIITLARGLNMTVTAGGVESRKQLDFLLDNSVDFLQGYLISEPLPEAEFDRFLKTNPDFYTRHI